MKGYTAHTKVIGTTKHYYTVINGIELLSLTCSGLLNTVIAFNNIGFKK